MNLIGTELVIPVLAGCAPPNRMKPGPPTNCGPWRRGFSMAEDFLGGFSKGKMQLADSPLARVACGPFASAGNMTATTTKILFVDDESDLLSLYQRAMRNRFPMDTATSGEEALRLMAEQGPYAVIVADMRMPKMDGLQLLAQVGERWPETVRIMCTGDSDPQTAIEAINQGRVFSFLPKPASPEQLAAALEAGLAQFTVAQAERDVLERTLTGTVRLLTDLLSAVDPVRMGVSERLKEDMHRFLVALGGKGNWEYEMGAALSGIGYLTLPPAVLLRHSNREDLPPNEMEMVRRVPKAGAELVANIPRLGGVAQIILYQAKNYDGTGFPSDTVMGESIPAGARILRVLVDLADLRVRGMTDEAALELLCSRVDRYDPRVVATLKKTGLSVLRREPTVRPSPRAAASARFQHVAVDGLRPGHTLAEDLRTTEGLLIFAAGQAITPTKLQMIQNFARLSSIKQPIKVDTLG
jgi:response regulator RpfG family c-di-GMP phosphodiesterase